MNSAVEIYRVYFLGMTVVAYPSTAERTVIKPSANIAPVNTTNLECLIDMMAAIKNVLSPSSETMMTDKEATKAWMNSMLVTSQEPRDAEDCFAIESLKTAF